MSHPHRPEHIREPVSWLPFDPRERRAMHVRLPNDPLPRPHRAPTRRRFLAMAATLLASPAVVTSRRAAAAVPRTLSFRHTHTGEDLTITYATGDSYVNDALASVNWFLRDFRNDAVHPIDPRLLDQLHQLATITGTRAHFQVISGYRSPATNHALRANGRGVAERSLHVMGQAIDVRLADIPLADLRDAALSLRAGGVGYYAASQFVHVDTGPVRRW
jgi:uncharacterized protein YcbK (DUF882 family)